jgi:hypothetical protein
MAAESNGFLKWWQAAIGAATLIVAIALYVGATKAQTDENSRQIRQIQEETVKKEQLEDIKARLDRIERKIDRVEEERLSHR